MTKSKRNILPTIVATITVVALLFSGVFAVTTSTIMQSYVVCLLGFACVIALFTKIRIKDDKRWIYVIAIVSLAYLSIRAYLSPAIDLGQGDLFLILPAGALFFILQGVLNRVVYKRLMLGVLTVLFVLNILCFMPAIGEFRDSVLPFARGNEQSGMFNHRNFCSNLLMMGTLVWTVILCSKNVSGRKRLAAGLLSLAGLVCLFLASSRAGFVGFSIGFSVILAVVLTQLFKSNQIGKLPKVVAGMVLLVSLTLVIWVGGNLFETRQARQSEETGFGDRLTYFSMGVDQIPDAPLLGSGSMSYSYKYYENWGDADSNRMDHVWVHNEYIQAVTDYGLLGLSLILAFILAVISYGVTTFFRAVGHDAHGTITVDLRFAGLVIVLAFCFNMLVSFPAHSQPNLLLLVVAIDWALLRPRGKKEKSHERNRSSRLSALTVFLAIGFVSIALSYPAVRRANVYLSHGVYTDSQNWDVNAHLDDQSMATLEQVNQASPTYISYERLAGLYLNRALEVKTKSEKQLLYQRALDLSEASLKRHPYYSVALANKAKALWHLQRFREADVAFDLLVEQVKARQKFFHAYAYQADFLCDWGASADVNDTESLAIYAKALKAWKKSGYRRPQYSYSVLNRIVLGYGKKLIDLGELDRVENVLNELYRTRGGSPWNFDKSEVVLAHALLLQQYSKALFLKRQPEKSYKWLNKANYYFRVLKKKFPEVADKYGANYKAVLEQIQFFKETHTTPAK